MLLVNYSSNTNLVHNVISSLLKKNSIAVTIKELGFHFIPLIIVGLREETIFQRAYGFSLSGNKTKERSSK